MRARKTSDGLNLFKCARVQDPVNGGWPTVNTLRARQVAKETPVRAP
jgi:hypothetical protein